MKNNILCSIIIPVYKVEESFFRECLESALNIKRNDVEFLIIDDGSQDNCGAIADEYVRKDKRFTVIHKKNEGVSIARNVGLKKSKGKWIAFLDGDDWFDTKLIEEIFDYLVSFSGDLLCFGLVQRYENGKLHIAQPFNNIRVFENKTEIENLKKMVLTRKYDSLENSDSGSVFCNPSCKIFSNEIIEKNNIRFFDDIHYSEDALFNLYFLQYCKKIVFIPKIAYNYRMRSTSAIHSYNEKRKKEIKEFDSKIREYMKLYPQADNFYNAFQYRCIEIFMDGLDIKYFYSNSIKTIKERLTTYLDELNSSPVKEALESIEMKNIVSTDRKYKLKIWMLKKKMFNTLFLLITLNKVRKKEK